MERYVNKGSPSGFSAANSVSLETSPLGPNPRFQLPILAVELQKVIETRGLRDLPSPLSETFPYVAFPVHPDVIDAMRWDLDPHTGTVTFLPVAPSASARTVLYSDSNPPFWIKLHYPALIGRFERAIPAYRWYSSFEKSAELERVVDLGSAPSCFAFLPERQGVLIRVGKRPDQSAGVLYREFHPYPKKPERALIPLFSLFSPDSRRPEEPLLLTQMLATRADPFQACLDLIVKPLHTCFRFLALDLGLIPEYNAQNILIEIGEDITSPRMVHRDMMEPFVDLTLREQKGLHINFTRYHFIDNEGGSDEYYKRRSFEYDFKFGRYVLLELENLLRDQFGISPRRFRNAVRELFRTLVTNPVEYFGSDEYWYSYPDKIFHGTRPYIRRRHPQYR
jgi:hypothetical protein